MLFMSPVSGVITLSQAGLSNSHVFLHESRREPPQNLRLRVACAGRACEGSIVYRGRGRTMQGYEAYKSIRNADSSEQSGPFSLALSERNY